MSRVHWGSLILGIVLAIVAAWILGRRKVRSGG
jgi:hypothetical protein